MSTVRVTVITSFGCICCGCCQCQICGKGRKYQVALRNTDLVELIWEGMIAQNPQIRDREVKPDLYFGKEKLEFDRRVINYDMKDGSEILCNMPPKLCCVSEFRKAPKKVKKDAAENLTPSAQKVMDDPPATGDNDEEEEQV